MPECKPLRAVVATFGLLAIPAPVLAADAPGEPITIRVATFNIEDVRSEQLADSNNEKLCAIGEIIRAIDPDIILLNEIQFDQAGDPNESGKNAQRFADTYLNKHTGEAEPRQYTAFMAPSNTGIHSGHDLDNNGVNDPTSAGRDYGGDCLGYGEFPGQYAMALLVRGPHKIQLQDVRTFQDFRWKDVPNAKLPPSLDETGQPRDDQTWYSTEELDSFPLSSKSHWDVPVELSNGAVIHIIASHPTPPVFDGPEDRNGRRNHDEIRFLGEYISGASFMRDDQGRAGGLTPDASFIILGDLNADPETDADRGGPMIQWIFGNPRVAPDPKPESGTSVEGLKPWHTARFRLRVDYVLPSSNCRVLRSRVWRGPSDSPESGRGPELAEQPSDHFPVWVEVAVPAPSQQETP